MDGFSELFYSGSREFPRSVLILALCFQVPLSELFVCLGGAGLGTFFFKVKSSCSKRNEF